MSSEVASAYVSILPSWKGNTAALASQMGGDVEEAGKDAGSKWGGGFLSTAKYVIAGTAVYNGLIKGVDFAKTAVFGFNSTLQQSTIAFTTLLGSGQKAQAFLTQLQNFAKSTPFDFQGLVSNSQLLLGMGVSAKSIIPDLTALGDSVASVGGSSDELNNTILAFGQSMAKGTLDMGNMNQLLQGGIPTALKVLAAQYHVTTGQMVAMISAGKVQSSQALPLLVKGLEQGTSATAALGGMMDKQSQTFQGALSNIGDALTQSLAKAFLPFFNQVSSGLQGLATYLGSSKFSQLMSTFTSGMTAGMSAVGTVAGQVFNVILLPAFRALSAVVPPLVSLIGSLIKVVSPLAILAGGVLLVAWRAVLAVLTQLGPVLSAISGFLSGHAALIQTLAVAVTAGAIAWGVWTAAIATWTAVTEGAKAVVTAFTKVQAAFDAVMDANPIMLVVVAIAALAAGMVYAYGKSATFRAIIQDAFNGIKAAASAVASFFTHDIPASFDAVYNGAKSTLGNVVSFVESIPSKIKGVFDGAGSWLLSAGKSIVNGLWNGLKSLASGAGSYVSGVVGNIADALKNALDDVLGLPWTLPTIKLGAFGHYVTIGGETIFPRLAKGGIVMPQPGGALVNVAEAGQPEVVLPLNRLKDFGVNSGGQAQAVTVNQYIDGTKWDEQTLAIAVGRRLAARGI